MVRYKYTLIFAGIVVGSLLQANNPGSLVEWLLNKLGLLLLLYTYINHPLKPGHLISLDMTTYLISLNFGNSLSRPGLLS